MTPRRGRGRPRSEECRDAVLKTAMELMQEDDLRRASVDRISARSGVSKATIYKLWPNRTGQVRPARAVSCRRLAGAGL
jgi:AcrR family transcriptional regulator